MLLFMGSLGPRSLLAREQQTSWLRGSALAVWELQNSRAKRPHKHEDTANTTLSGIPLVLGLIRAGM